MFCVINIGVLFKTYVLLNKTNVVYLKFKCCSIKHSSSIERNVSFDKAQTFYQTHINVYEKLQKVDQEIQRDLMSIFLIKYLLKSQGSRPGDPKRAYENIPI